jgi:tetratricopeptide (TPR) repeat protein
MSMKKAVWLMVGSVVLAGAMHAGAQSGAAMPPMEGMHALPAPEQLPVPIHMTGIGNSHITIKATPEAQAWFDQGLSLLHDFWDYESAKAFEQGIRVDPNCAMCYWGLDQAESMRGGPEQSFGDQAIERAVRLERKASKTDRLYIEAARAQQRSPLPSHQKAPPDGAAIAIFRKLVKKEPQDIEARIFLANAVGDGFDDKGEPKPGMKEKIAILEGVLKDAPNDSAANHYWIHAMEPSNHPERAIASAALLASLAPTSGHMVHMPGHIYYRVGDYSSADHWFAASTAADEKYMREQHVDVDDDWNYVHNMMYGIANLMEQGRLEDANALSDHLAGARGELSATLYIWSARDQVSRVSRRLPVALRVGDWADVLSMLDESKLPDSDETTNLRFLKDELRSFARGMQALDRGDLATAKEASAELDAGLWRQSRDAKVSAEDKTKAGVDRLNACAGPGKTGSSQSAMAPVNPDADAGPLVSTFSIASQELRAGVLLLDGKTDAAKKLYTEAIVAEKKLGYHEPPFYIRPVAETEAEALLRAKDYPDAKAAYQAALIERPASGFELYGIAHADELAGSTAQAQTEYRAFLKAWPSADQKLPEMLHAREAAGDAGTVAEK